MEMNGQIPCLGLFLQFIFQGQTTLLKTTTARFSDCKKKNSTTLNSNSKSLELQRRVSSRWARQKEKNKNKNNVHVCARLAKILGLGIKAHGWFCTTWTESIIFKRSLHWFCFCVSTEEPGRWGISYLWHEKWFCFSVFAIASINFCLNSKKKVTIFFFHLAMA